MYGGIDIDSKEEYNGIKSNRYKNVYLQNVQLLIIEPCYENKNRSQDLTLDNKCFQQL